MDENIPLILKNQGFSFAEIIEQINFPELSESSTNLLSKGSSSSIHDLWKKQKMILPLEKNKNVIPLEIEEENLLRQYLEQKTASLEGNKFLIRKLTVRDLQRKNHLRNFDINNELVRPVEEKTKYISCYGQGRQNSFQLPVPILRIISQNEEIFLKERISPFTARKLKPFIRRDFEMSTPWIDLMLELKFCVGGSENVERMPIDFCYVDAQHIPVVNSLCEHFFWPGIDLSECLQYPDFSIIALYGKLIVGFAFLVPDTKHNEAYVSFLLVLPGWRRSNIASFMLYHLIHTCMGKDVTLHVAVDNPALFLYQKFGFKVEQLDLNFYQNYFDHTDRSCRHAFFMRLER